MFGEESTQRSAKVTRHMLSIEMHGCSRLVMMMTCAQTSSLKSSSLEVSR